ncbi:MAG TPA: lmo0937 family membrane protein [Candidatus Binatia bacterium]
MMIKILVVVLLLWLVGVLTAYTLGGLIHLLLLLALIVLLIDVLDRRKVL